MTDVLKYRFCQISGFSKCDIGLFSHLVWFLMGPWRPKLTNLSAVFCKKYKFKVNMHPEVIKIKSPPGTPWLQGKVTEFTWMGGTILLCGIWGSIKVGANPGSRQGKITKTIRGRSHITSAAGAKCWPLLTEGEGGSRKPWFGLTEYVNSPLCVFVSVHLYFCIYVSFFVGVDCNPPRSDRIAQ